MSTHQHYQRSLFLSGLAVFLFAFIEGVFIAIGLVLWHQDVSGIGHTLLLLSLAIISILFAGFLIAYLIHFLDQWRRLRHYHRNLLF